MQEYYVSYCKEFNCLAGKCPDTCCKMWEINIDEDTLYCYRHLSGELGDKIKSRLVDNGQDDVYFSLENGACPFLDKDGLCEIHRNLGVEYTSRICREHPRFFEEYYSYVEIGLFLSCPEAARLILNCDTSDMNSVYPTPEYSGDDEMLVCLLNSRKKLLGSKSDFNGLCTLLFESAKQDYFYIFEEEINYISPIDCVFLRDFILFYLENCEFLTESWKNILEKCLTANISDSKLSEYIKENNKKMCRCFYYYLYRYYTKAVNDDGICAKAMFIVMSVLLSALCAIVNGISFDEAARLYSKEVEHSTDNLDIINEYLDNCQR